MRYHVSLMVITLLSANFVIKLPNQINLGYIDYLILTPDI